MSRFDRARKILSMVLGLTSLGSFDASALKKVGAKKPSTFSKDKSSSEKASKKANGKKIGNQILEKKKDKKGKDAQKPSGNNQKKIEKFKGSIAKKPFDLQKQISKSKEKASSSNFLLKQFYNDGKWQWTPTSIVTTSVLGAMALGVPIYPFYNKITGKNKSGEKKNENENTATSAGKENSGKKLTEENSQEDKPLDSSKGGNNKDRDDNKKQSGQEQNKEINNYKEALEIVRGAFGKDCKNPPYTINNNYCYHSTLMLKIDKNSISDSLFAGYDPTRNNDKKNMSGYSYDPQNVNHVKRIIHNLKLAGWNLWNDEKTLGMSADEFEAWLALKLLSGVNLGKDSLVGQTLRYDNGDGKWFELKLHENGMVSWNVGSKFGRGCKVSFGNSEGEKVEYNNEFGGLLIAGYKSDISKPESEHYFAYDGNIDNESGKKKKNGEHQSIIGSEIWGHSVTMNAYKILICSVFEPLNSNLCSVCKYDTSRGKIWDSAIVKAYGKILEEVWNCYGFDKIQIACKKSKEGKKIFMLAQAIACIRSFAGQVSTAVNCENTRLNTYSRGNAHFISLSIAAALDGIILKEGLEKIVDFSTLIYDIRLPSRLPNYGIGPLYEFMGKIEKKSTSIFSSNFEGVIIG